MALNKAGNVTFGGTVAAAVAGVNGPGAYGGVGGVTGGSNTSGLLTGTVNSDPIDCTDMQGISFVGYVNANGGSTAAGTLQVQGTNDPNCSSANANAAWTNIGTTGAVSVASGTTGYSAYSMPFPFRYARLQYTFTSGGSAATMTAIYQAKGISNNG
jgi:hypothetical protein